VPLSVRKLPGCEKLAAIAHVPSND
jgi:hypothetical protein